MKSAKQAFNSVTQSDLPLTCFIVKRKQIHVYILSRAHTHTHVDLEIAISCFEINKQIENEKIILSHKNKTKTYLLLSITLYRIRRSQTRILSFGLEMNVIIIYFAKALPMILKAILRILLLCFCNTHWPEREVIGQHRKAMDNENTYGNQCLIQKFSQKFESWLAFWDRAAQSLRESQRSLDQNRIRW